MFSLIVPLLLVACGSSRHAATTARHIATQEIHGPGFAFSTPAAWRLGHTFSAATATSRAKRPATVSAELYRLGKAYTDAQFAAAAKELDGVATRLARAAGTTVGLRESTIVDGRRIRAYRFTASTGDAVRVGFLLDGKREIQLLCQAPRGPADPDGACGLLFATFRLTG